MPRRGKAREYTAPFDAAWRAYGRKEQKFEAFSVWLLRAKDVGSEARLLQLTLAALKWQGPDWARDGWKFAPYFERYLKRRKWEDEKPPAPQFNAGPRLVASTAALAATDQKVAELRAAQATVAPTLEQLRALRAAK